MAVEIYTTAMGPLSRVRDGMALRVRKKIFDAFMRECRPSKSSRVADFGVTGLRNHPVHYFFETHYPHHAHLTVIGREAEGAGWYPDAFPGVTFVEADLRSIPLPDGYFDAGICNAVIEHAGTREEQAKLVAEVCRVCRNVLFTTPNKRFPVELHTFLPFVHWLPDPGFRFVLRAIGQHELARVENLNPLDAKTLLSLFPTNRHTRRITLGSGILATNLVFVSRSDGS